MDLFFFLSSTKSEQKKKVIDSLFYHELLFSWKMLIPFYTELPFEKMLELKSDVKIVHGKIRKMIDYKNKIRTDKGKENLYVKSLSLQTLVVKPSL